MLSITEMFGVVASQPRWSDWLPEPGASVELLALGRSGSSICACLGGGHAKVLISLDACSLPPVPGECFTVAVARRTRRSGLWLLEGTVRSPRLEASALRLEPLALRRRRSEPAKGGERGRSGPGEFELEPVEPRVPGFPAAGRTALDEITAFWESGDTELAEMLVGELLARDLRCLDAHAALGGFFLNAPLEERWTERALRHYRVGVTIGELSLEPGFEGFLPWRWPGNRGLLRCLDGYARCLGRVGDADAARQIYCRLSSLSPGAPFPVGIERREHRQR